MGSEYIRTLASQLKSSHIKLSHPALTIRIQQSMPFETEYSFVPRQAWRFSTTALGRPTAYGSTWVIKSESAPYLLS